MKDLLALNSLKEHFQTSEFVDTSGEFIINALILIILTLIMSYVYIKTDNSLSNRKRLAAIFPLLALTTMMIITVIQSSLALSLGLVGALSIIRFRSAIKDPEELAYIFLAISLGLGMGADKLEITISFFAIAMIFVIVRSIFSKKMSFFDHKTDQGLYFDLTVKKSISMDKIISLLDQECSFIDFKRVDQRDRNQQFLFLIKVDEYSKISNLQSKVEKLDPKAKLVILNDEGLFV